MNSEKEQLIFLVYELYNALEMANKLYKKYKSSSNIKTDNLLEEITINKAINKYNKLFN